MTFPTRYDRLLVIAPHPDDDVIGCGGTLARAVALGRRCDVVYVTDGSASHPRSRRYPPDRLRDVREAEARAGLACLGVTTEPAFLRARDGALATLDADANARLVAALAARLDERRPACVLVPWHRDPHPDHVATAALVERALARANDVPACFAYGVWLSQRGSPADVPRADEAEAIDVELTSDELARKRRAILAHRSQTGDLIDDDPGGFRITSDHLERWLAPVERFYRRIVC